MNKILLFVLIAALSVPVIGGAAEDAFALAVRPGFDALSPGIITLPPNDDESSGFPGPLVPVNLGFSGDIKFFSFESDETYVNNNGNISFDSSLSDFTPINLSNVGKIIAPFWADVDTRFTGMPVTYGTGMVDGRDAFGVNWVMVDCKGVATPDIDFPPATVFNTFQLILIERFDTGAKNFDIELNYDSINWETGDASGGDESCLGGTSARIGYSDGATTTFEFPGSGDNGAFLDSGPPSTSLIQNSLNSPVLGRYTIPVRDGIPNPEPVEIIGGEIIPLESISILLAGAQSISWIIPMSVSIVGIGLVLVKRRIR